MSTGKISWMIDDHDWMTIIKVDGLAFPTIPEGEDAAKFRFEHMQKYKIGTRMSLENFCNNEDYNSLMWTIIPKDFVQDKSGRALTINV